MPDNIYKYDQRLNLQPVSKTSFFTNAHHKDMYGMLYF